MRRARGPWTVVMDADLQDPPEAIPALLQAAGDDVDVVFAGRRGRYESRLRLLTSRLFKRTLAVATGLPADAGMFFVANRHSVEVLTNMKGATPFVVAMIGRSGPADALHSRPTRSGARGQLLHPGDEAAERDPRPSLGDAEDSRGVEERPWSGPSRASARWSRCSRFSCLADARRSGDRHRYRGRPPRRGRAGGAPLRAGADAAPRRPGHDSGQPRRLQHAR